MSVCVSASGPAIGLGSTTSSGILMPQPHHNLHHHHHHHRHHLHMPGLMQSLTGGGGPINHSAGHPLGMGAHLFHPSASSSSAGSDTTLVVPQSARLLGHSSPNPLGTMDSQCPASRPSPAGTGLAAAQPPPLPLISKSLVHTATATAARNTSSSGDDQYPNSDMLLALIARNKSLEGECGLCEDPALIR